jgi:site-specific DNA-methyltransferase (adenine-specific)
MNTQASFTLHGRNPDVLTCIANLSNDEVFTPPEFANRMLDTMADAWAADHGGANLWADKNLRFLDPFTKSGVFLREITKRLTEGLKDEIPDLQARVDHILTQQVFGIAITHLTSLLARRSLYCSKFATGTHSVAKGFAKDAGNIWFDRTEHTWKDGRCVFCGASQKTLERGEGFETYAYAFIHTDNIKARMVELFGGAMQFDVIIGNPPYQLNDASNSASATPIYQKFVEQALALEPRYLAMVTPSRWFVGGKGLDAFRRRMLTERRLKVIVDYVVDKDAFPKINVNGGVNFFLWDRDHLGDCAITTVEKGGVVGLPVLRSLSEFDVFIRRNNAVSILRKVQARQEPTFAARVSARKPFGLPTNFFGAGKPSPNKSILLHSSGRITWVARSEIVNNIDWIDRWKVLVGRATDGNETYPLPIWDQRGPFACGPGEACSETYLIASVVENEEQAGRIVNYMRTIFFRFLVSLRKITQDNKADVFAFVPDIALERVWTDQALNERYALSEDEIGFMSTIIRDAGFSG